MSKGDSFLECKDNSRYERWSKQPNKKRKKVDQYRMNEEKTVIISFGTEKAFEKIQPYFMI